MTHEGTDDANSNIQAGNSWDAIRALLSQYCPKLGPNELLAYSSIGLATESAEVLDVYKKAIGHMPEVDHEHVVEELGDVFYAAAMLMMCEQITLAEVHSTLAAKLGRMYPLGYWSQEQYLDYRRKTHGGQLK